MENNGKHATCFWIDQCLHHKSGLIQIACDKFINFIFIFSFFFSFSLLHVVLRRCSALFADMTLDLPFRHKIGIWTIWPVLPLSTIALPLWPLAFFLSFSCRAISEKMWNLSFLKIEWRKYTLFSLLMHWNISPHIFQIWSMYEV